MANRKIPWSVRDPSPGGAIDNYGDLEAYSRPYGSRIPGDNSGQFNLSPGAINIPPIPINIPAMQAFLNPDQLTLLLDAPKKWRGQLLQQPFTVGVNPQLLLPEMESRYYLFILNTSNANRLGIGIGSSPGNFAASLPIAANLGAYEPEVVPTNSIYIIGQAAGTTGIIVYGV